MTDTVASAGNPGDNEKPRGITLDVHPRLDDEFAATVAQSVAVAVETALRNVLFGINLTEDERLAVEMYRAQRDANAVQQEIHRRDAHARIGHALHARDGEPSSHERPAMAAQEDHGANRPWQPTYTTATLYHRHHH